MAGRKQQKAQFHEGEKAQKRFESVLNAILSVSKEEILEAEIKGREKRAAPKKKRRNGPH